MLRNQDLEIKDPNKLYYTYNDIHNLVLNLSNKIKNSDFKPDYILAIGEAVIFRKNIKDF